MKTAVLLVALLAASAAAAATPAAKQAKLDPETKEAEVTQLKELLLQIDQDHGRKTPEEKLEKEAKNVLTAIETGKPQADAGAAGAAEQSTEQSAEASAPATGGSESSSEASGESSGAAASGEGGELAKLEAQLADLMTKKDSGKVTGEDLEKLNVEIELVLEKIKKIKGAAAEESSEESSSEGASRERNDVERIVDVLLAHLTTLREKQGELAALHDVDLQDVVVQQEKLAGLIAAHRGGAAGGSKCETDECGNPKVEAAVAPAPTTSKCVTDECGNTHVVTEAEEKPPCSDKGCDLAQMTVIPAVKGANSTSNATVVPKTTVNGAAAESKSAVSTCDPCAAKRQTCHSACEAPKCHDECHTQHAACEKTSCGPQAVRSDVVKPSTVSACPANAAEPCKSVVPTVAPAGSLTDKNSFLFM